MDANFFNWGMIILIVFSVGLMVLNLYMRKREVDIFEHVKNLILGHPLHFDTILFDPVLQGEWSSFANDKIYVKHREETARNSQGGLSKWEILSFTTNEGRHLFTVKYENGIPFSSLFPSCHYSNFSPREVIILKQMLVIINEQMRGRVVEEKCIHLNVG